MGVLVQVLPTLVLWPGDLVVARWAPTSAWRIWRATLYLIAWLAFLC